MIIKKMTKETSTLRTVLDEYRINDGVSIEPFGSGLINNTWIVKDRARKYILQRINDNVFREPGAIAFNIEYLSRHIKKNHPEYKFAEPVSTPNGKTMLYKENGYYRMFFFVEGSHTIDVVKTAQQAYEAATQFGKFTRVFDGIDVNNLKITIPDFHNLGLRYRQFLKAISGGNAERKKEATSLITLLEDHSLFVTEYQRIKTDPDFVRRVTHHDTKISNVLFDENDKGICVIDLDTVMPGYFISDVGDMMRTYLSPVSEEETVFSKIEIREEFYEAIVNGYYNEMQGVLTAAEKQHFFYAGCFMTYMQALRFLTDYLNDDIYYGEKYPGHNLNRAGNQAELLQRLLEKKDRLKFNR
jgi:Ser/Thr protein kinase RdoA (MazF antagonist)